MNVVLLVIVGAALVASGLIVAGIYLLLGLAWALIASGLFLFGGLSLIRSGMVHG